MPEIYPAPSPLRLERLGLPWPWVVEHSGEDGVRMADDKGQGWAMDDAYEALQGRFEFVDNAYIGKDVLVYSEEGNPNQAVARMN